MVAAAGGRGEGAKRYAIKFAEAYTIPGMVATISPEAYPGVLYPLGVGHPLRIFPPSPKYNYSSTVFRLRLLVGIESHKVYLYCYSVLQVV